MASMVACRSHLRRYPVTLPSVTPPPQVLAIDLGTSGPEGGAGFRPTARCSAGNPNPSISKLIPGGGAEQDPERVVGGHRRRPRGGSSPRTSCPSPNIVAISVTSQWSGTVAVDTDGNAIGNAVIWMDSRGARYVDESHRRPRSQCSATTPGRLARWIRLTGGAPSGSGKDPIAHILFLRHERPDVYAEGRRSSSNPRTI